MAVLLEVCVDSAAGLSAAVLGGANRIELCCALDLGGLTPSPGLIALASASPVPVHAMIRPRAGGFVFGEDDVAAMLADIDAVRAAGLAGVVLGASHADHRLDTDVLRRLLRHADGLCATLHRAFDLVPDPFEALETAVALGFSHILTSGQALRAADATQTLAALVDKAAGRISIMAGSGVSPANVAGLIAETGVREVHASCREVVAGGNSRSQAFGFEGEKTSRTSSAIVRRMREILDTCQG